VNLLFIILSASNAQQFEGETKFELAISLETRSTQERHPHIVAGTNVKGSIPKVTFHPQRKSMPNRCSLSFNF